MNQIIYWKNPAPMTSMDDATHWPVGFGPEDDMPEGAATGERELPTTLQIGWRNVVTQGRKGNPVVRRVFEVVSPPLIVRGTAYRAHVALTEEEVRWLASADTSTFDVLELCRERIKGQSTFAPPKDARKTNWWWLVHDGWWLTGAAHLPLQRKWHRAVIEVIAAGHPNLSAILATWDRWIAGDPRFPYGRKRAGRLVIANEPYACRGGACPQVFELRLSTRSARPYLYRCSGTHRYGISVKDVQPVCDESLEEMNITPVVGLAAMLANHRVQTRAAPSAHARLELENHYERVLRKWSERFDSWRAQALSQVARLPEAERQNLIDRPIEAAITALFAFTDVTDPKMNSNGTAGSACDARAQDYCDDLFALREDLATKTVRAAA